MSKGDMYRPEGTIIFQAPNVTVTATYVLIGRESCAVSDIISVEMGYEESRPSLLGVIAGVLGAAGILVGMGAVEAILEGDFAFGMAWLGVAAGVLIMGILLALPHAATSREPRHTVRIRTAEGQHEIYRSTDIQDVFRIVAAIKDAISRREPQPGS